MGTFEQDVSGIGALADQVRRQLYLFVCAQPGPVSRDQAADAVGIAQHRAKFHLDRLEADGLLESGYARTTGRTGPGAGRTAKLYHRTQRDISVSLPDREYELAGRMMAEAISESTRTGEPVADTLHRAATAAGQAMVDGADGSADSPDRALAVATKVLQDNGYEPRREDDRIVLANCPFHSLAGEHPALVCGMNLSLLTAMSGSLAGRRLQARLAPAAGRCCVVLTAPTVDEAAGSPEGADAAASGVSDGEQPV
nr:helix-turn-helix domain-containing protein [Nakamurella lactea]